MGLCKCPKKKVTNQFCFEHRVNVCEHCIVADHTKCVVQSYLQWLNDSEYSPTCSLCNQPLESQVCTRLVCYDVFHSSCLERWGSSHPPHTAPAGFRCPVCRSTVFPAPQLASPVALALKQTLATWSWARKAMGVPAVAADDWSSKNGVAISHGGSNKTKENVMNGSINNSLPSHAYNSSSQGTAAYSTSTTVAASATAHDVPSATIPQTVSSTYRKPSPTDSHSLNVPDGSDVDENKYKRRSALMWFKRWWRSYQPLGSGNRGAGRRRMIALLCVILLCTVLLLLASARSRHAGDDADLDSIFDPHNNPNIHVQDTN